MESVPQQDRARWLERFRSSEPSQVLREMASAYKVGRPELGMMLGELFEDVTTEEVQAVWHWDMAKNGRGLSDDDLNELIGKLALKK